MCGFCSCCKPLLLIIGGSWGVGGGRGRGGGGGEGGGGGGGGGLPRVPGQRRAPPSEVQSIVNLLILITLSSVAWRVL